MKKCINIDFRGWRVFLLGISVFLFVQCDKDVEIFSSEDLQKDTSIPDLRFANIDDEYSFPANQSEPDTFLVKSLYHSWEVVGKSDNPWYVFSPSKGEAGTLYEVEFYPNDNTELDDRVDTLTLISEDWVGKTFVIFQKGTAYLVGEVDDPTLSESLGDRLSINVSSNQDWTAKLAENYDWVAIDGDASGNGDGVVTLVTTQENGALRKQGMVYFYDRNNILADSVTIYQQGIYLEVENAPEQIAVAGGSIEVQISSNTNWNLTIPESAQSWLSVDNISGSNNSTLNFTVLENIGQSRSVYVYLESDPAMVEDSILFDQLGAIPFTEEYFNGGSGVTFNSDGSATLYAAPGTGSKTLTSKISDFSYGKYTVYFKDIQIAYTSSTMLMCITTADKFNGGISWGANANASFSDGWASEYWVSDGFGSKIRKRVDNDILRDDIEKYIIDIKKSETPGMVVIDFYINDELIVSEEGLDGFASGDPMILTFWIYNYYDKENAAVFEPSKLIYEPYKY